MGRVKHPISSKDRERFWVKTEPQGRCIVWIAATLKSGHGIFSQGGGPVYAHVFAFEDCVRPLAPGEEVHHRCENKPCVKPSHLMAVTRKQHIALTPNSISWQRKARTHCARGHPYSGDNLRLSSSGVRRCKACWVAAKERAKLRNNDDKREELTS